MGVVAVVLALRPFCMFAWNNVRGELEGPLSRRFRLFVIVVALMIFGGLTPLAAECCCHLGASKRSLASSEENFASFNVRRSQWSRRSLSFARI